MRSTNIAKHSERRTKARFPFRRQMRYKVLHNNGATLISGNGQTLDISSAGIAFVIEGQVAADAYVELSISWPVLLHNDCPMQLIVFGRMLRSEAGRSVCSIDKYEFRTRGRVTQPGTVDQAGMTGQFLESFQKDSGDTARPRQFQL